MKWKLRGSTSALKDLGREEQGGSKAELVSTMYISKCLVAVVFLPFRGSGAQFVGHSSLAKPP